MAIHPHVFYLNLRDSWRRRRAKRAAARMLAGMDRSLCPCQEFVPLPARKLAGEGRPPSGGLGYGNHFKYRTQDGFHSFQLQKKGERNVFHCVLAPGRNALFGCLPAVHKAGFLGENATGGKRAGGEKILAALGKNMLRLSNYFVNRFAPDAKLPECTAASHLWPLSLPSPSN